MIKPLRILKYLLKLLIKSPVKTAFLIVGILLLYPIYNLDYDKKEPRKVINTFKNGVEYCYVISGMTVVESDVEISIDKYGMILVDVENPTLIFTWIGFVICCIAIVIGIFADDDDINWSFRDNYIEALHDDVKCEMEDIGNQETYYYTLDGKLILKSNTHKSRIYNEVESYYESPNLYLKFETKQKKRNNKLEEILQ
jgi:hypothetical protein